MPFIAYIAPFIPFLAMVPPSLAAMWIASRWLKSRHGGGELLAEVTALREEIAALHQDHAEVQERLDLAERMLSQLRQAPRELSKGAP